MVCWTKSNSESIFKNQNQNSKILDKIHGIGILTKLKVWNVFLNFFNQCGQLKGLKEKSD